MADMVEEARELADRIAKTSRAVSNDPSIARIIVTIEERNLIVRALHCLANVNSETRT